MRIMPLKSITDDGNPIQPRVSPAQSFVNRSRGHFGSPPCEAKLFLGGTVTQLHHGGKPDAGAGFW